MTEDYKDVNGREYARLSELKPGDRVQVDDGFDCMEPWSIKEVQCNENGDWFINCSKVEHDLYGQLMDDRDHLMGIYKEPTP